jgi:hypothetical protein
MTWERGSFMIAEREETFKAGILTVMRGLEILCFALRRLTPSMHWFVLQVRKNVEKISR